MLKTLFFLFPVILLNSAAISTTEQVAVQGIVIDKQTNQPISNSYIYIVRGEEEALTDSKGKFSINTWQSLPVTLTVDDPKYKKVTITVSKAGTKHVIPLEAR